MAGKYIEPMPLTDWTRRLRHRAMPRWPSQCAICHGWGRGRLCGDCTGRFGAPRPRCRRCAIELPAAADTCGGCLADPPPWDRCIAAADYAYPWDGLVQGLKFHARLDLAPALAQRMLGAWHEAGAGAPGLVLPMPLADARWRERGHNQAWELARRLARALDAPADPHLLLRVKDTPHQLALPRREREANVRGAFAVEPLRAAELRGRSVTLVDDVVTTGATAAEAVRTLRQAGAADVTLWVAARTPRQAGEPA